MKINIENYEIEQDRSCYILTTYKVAEKGDKVGEKYISDQIYPATLESALLKVSEKIKNKDIQLEVGKLLTYIRTENNEFLDKLRVEINKI